MMEGIQTDTDRTSGDELERYYRFHAPIYDFTRWSFLFGRKAVIRMIPDLPHQPNILEIGCGTGNNLKHLKTHFPDARIVGTDLSEEMLNMARDKVDKSADIQLQKSRYGSDPIHQGPFDLILLSYSLTMMNADLEETLIQIKKDLHPGGIAAIVDFHTSPFGWFRRWMNYNHVDFSGQLLPLLRQHFYPVKTEVKQAYGGWWSYFQCIGRPKS